MTPDPFAGLRLVTDTVDGICDPETGACEVPVDKTARRAGDGSEPVVSPHGG